MHLVRCCLYLQLAGNALKALRPHTEGCQACEDAERRITAQEADNKQGTTHTQRTTTSRDVSVCAFLERILKKWVSRRIT
eukprot:2642731-Amphidinium_carterae.1